MARPKRFAQSKDRRDGPIPEVHFQAPPSCAIFAYREPNVRGDIGGALILGEYQAKQYSAPDTGASRNRLPNRGKAVATSGQPSDVFRARLDHQHEAQAGTD
jgi:hypothetical protein